MSPDTVALVLAMACTMLPAIPCSQCSWFATCCRQELGIFQSSPHDEAQGARSVDITDAHRRHGLCRLSTLHLAVRSRPDAAPRAAAVSARSRVLASQHRVVWLHNAAAFGPAASKVSSRSVKGITLMANKVSQEMLKLWERRLAAAATKSTASGSSLSKVAAPKSFARTVRYCCMLCRNTCHTTAAHRLQP